ncbi:2265_t:CDS:2, partial [Scutellospora calospora]
FVVLVIIGKNNTKKKKEITKLNPRPIEPFKYPMMNFKKKEQPSHQSQEIINHKITRSSYQSQVILYTKDNEHKE